MTDMFDNYPQKEEYIPDNRKCFFPKEVVTIMPGETTTHSFEIPFDVSVGTIDYSIIYKVGLHIALEKGKSSCEVVWDEERNISIMTWVLSVPETMLFKDTLLDTHVQIKFTMVDGSIAFTEIYPVFVQNSLRSNAIGPEPEPPVPPHVITGFGYTED